MHTGDQRRRLQSRVELPEVALQRPHEVLMGRCWPSGVNTEAVQHQRLLHWTIRHAEWYEVMLEPLRDSIAHTELSRLPCVAFSKRHLFLTETLWSDFRRGLSFAYKFLSRPKLLQRG